MHVDLMRKIDRYAGIPLCLAVTLLLKCLHALFPPKASPPKKVLFIALSEMGSVILAGPAVRKARQDLGAEVFFAIFSKNRKSLEIQNSLPQTNIFGIRSQSFLLLAWDCLRFLAWTRKNRIDTVVDMELFSRISALLSGLSGAVNIAGFCAFHAEGLYRGGMITHRTVYNPHQHISRNFLALVHALSAARPEVPHAKVFIPDSETVLDKVRPSAQVLENMRDRFRAVFPSYHAGVHRLVLVNPHAGEFLPQRRWAPESFASVARMILEQHPDAVILITGDLSESPDAETLKKAVNSERCVNFAGQCQVPELPALYSLSLCMLTNDSGPAHFAAVTDMPTYVLFGPETPALYAPLGNCTPIYAGLACSPCVSAFNHRKTPCTDNVCLQAITPEHVFGLMRQTLEQ